MNRIAEFIKTNRKAAGLTQEEFAIRSGLGLRFVRELEQGKPTVRMDKVNIALAMFDVKAVPGRKENKSCPYSELLIFMFEIFMPVSFAKPMKAILSLMILTI